MFLQRFNYLFNERSLYRLTSTINRLLLRYASGASVGILEKWKMRLEEERVPEIDSSIKNILAHVLDKRNLDDADTSTTLKLTDDQRSLFERLCQCRVARMPIQYIIGEWDFRDLTLKMHPPVFIPRPESEELVELILQQFDNKRPMRFLEVGCGSGAISLALLKALPKSICIAIDQSRMACELTIKNSIELDVQSRIKVIRHKLTETSELTEFEGQLDLIVSNPPYVPSDDIKDLQPEIKLYEDLRALDGGPDGMTVIKATIHLASKRLRKKGMLWMEVDPRHPAMIGRFLDEHEELQLKFVAAYNDMFQKERFVEIIKV